eukprot:COSAG02_NODE_7551_length_2965_cov_3.215980_5_plen_75_part_00
MLNSCFACTGTRQRGQIDSAGGEQQLPVNSPCVHPSRRRRRQGGAGGVQRGNRELQIDSAQLRYTQNPGQNNGS